MFAQAHRDAVVRHANDDQPDAGPGVEQLVHQPQLRRVRLDESTAAVVLGRSPSMTSAAGSGTKSGTGARGCFEADLHRIFFRKQTTTKNALAIRLDAKKWAW
jgi:hypothetical protein